MKICILFFRQKHGVPTMRMLSGCPMFSSQWAHGANSRKADLDLLILVDELDAFNRYLSDAWFGT